MFAKQVLSRLSYTPLVLSLVAKAWWKLVDESHLVRT